MEVPPTALKVTSEAFHFIKSREKANAFWNYATLHAEYAVVVEDEVVAGELLVAAAVFLGITHIRVLVEHGDPHEVRRIHENRGTAHGSPLPT